MRKEEVQKAVEEFWSERQAQIDKLEDQGKAGGAARANGHMGGFTNLVAQEFINAGVPAKCIKKGKPYLPGYYRVRKQWDLAIVWEDILVAAIEFKSQVGSVGKNINNRFEEALGTATDTHAAHTKNETYGEVPPWLGYVFVLQETTETEKKNRSTKALFSTDVTFEGMSYNERYQEMVKRFIGERVYQAGWFVTTKVTDEGIVYNEPLATAAAAAFAVQIRGQVEYVKTVLDAMR
ncbi:Restriction endonuclease XhoI [Streptosporangium canum]|uniref:Restriction endonuclease XhoI n=1 Tax=Streptosporangium canum TaxID=324952 RepID=A0A1I4FDJ2_9ACTN|nr:PaeR7I family type II restriction endonuclease [Streptosporangium canum]SFL14906.1 Restriction endonuclease XhoI [Streptosporangium canum]